MLLCASAVPFLLALLVGAQPAVGARRGLAQAPPAVPPAAQPLSPASEPGGIAGPQVDVCIALVNVAGQGCSVESDTSERGRAGRDAEHMVGMEQKRQSSGLPAAALGMLRALSC